VSAALGKSDCLVIGGGLAGAMVGLRLAASGREVALLERERAPHHKVCGEFLSPEAVEYLRQAGVDPVALGAQAIRFLRLASKQRVVETDLPFTALSLSRCVLDEALLERAAMLGCTVERGAYVDSLESCDGQWKVQLRGGESRSGTTVFLANGKHDLRGLERQAGKHGDLVGFKLHWRLASAQTEALRAFMDLFLFPGGYGGLSLVEDDSDPSCEKSAAGLNCSRQFWMKTRTSPSGYAAQNRFGNGRWLCLPFHTDISRDALLAYGVLEIRQR